MSNDRNIYKSARMGAGLTQERAAELIDTSVESIRAYETGARTPPADKLVLMSEIYNSINWLPYQHMKANAEMGKILPDAEPKSFPVATLSLLKELHDVHAMENIIIDITSAGYVEESQKALFEKFMKEVRDLSGATITFLFAEKGGG